MGDLNKEELKKQLEFLSDAKTLTIFGGYGSHIIYNDIIPDTWESWGLNDVYIKKYNKWFELHTMRNIKHRGNKDHYRWLKECDRPIYMKKHYKTIPNSIEYPINEMLDKYGPIFTNTFDYMLAMAIKEKFEKIWLFGIAFNSIREYIQERQSYCYMLGVCKGLGIEVYSYYDIMRIQHIYQYPEIDVEKYWYGTSQEEEIWGE